MKVGDIVRMRIYDNDEYLRWEEWGTGIILSIEISAIGGNYDVEVLWSEIGVSWENDSMLELLS